MFSVEQIAIPFWEHSVDNCLNCSLFNFLQKLLVHPMPSEMYTTYKRFGTPHAIRDVYHLQMFLVHHMHPKCIPLTNVFSTPMPSEMYTTYKRFWYTPCHPRCIPLTNVFGTPHDIRDVYHLQAFLVHLMLFEMYTT